MGSQARIFEEHNQADGGDTNCAEISSSRTSCRLCHVDPFINMLWLSAPPSADNGGGVQHPFLRTPTTPACTWWNRPEEDNSSGKLESTHPSRTSIKSDKGFFGVESVMRVNADSLLIRAAATSTSGTLNDLTTDLIMANNNNNNAHRPMVSPI